jgi:phage gp29-like protein
VYFQRLVETNAFNDAQKTKLRSAVEPLVKSATKDHQKESYEKLLAKLK